MTRDELVEWLTYLAVKGGAADKRALVMLSMTPLRQGGPTNSGARLIKRVGLSIDGGKGVRFVEMSIEYIVADAAMIEVAWRKAFAGTLQLEPCSKVESDNAGVADGLIALLCERPVLTIAAIGDDCLEMRIGGFDRSRIYHPGNLIGLCRQIIETGTRLKRRLLPLSRVRI